MRGALMIALLGYALPGLAAENQVVLIANPQLTIDAIPRDTARLRAASPGEVGS